MIEEEKKVNSTKEAGNQSNAAKESHCSLLMGWLTKD